MKFDDAALLLDEHAPGRPPFVQHSHVVASVADRVARALREASPGVDAEAIRVSALLHDFGRSRHHGNYHGWIGYAMLRHRGFAAQARGCVTHWLRGMSFDEILDLSSIHPDFLKRVFRELDLPQLRLEDLVISVSDFSVAHTTIVPIDAREADLVVRYGDSRWLRRNAQLAREQRGELERRMGRPLPAVIEELAP